MSSSYQKIAVVTFWGAIVFLGLHVVYGYFFGVWSELAQALGGFKPLMSKFGETMLFGFLAITLPLVSLAANRLGRND